MDKKLITLLLTPWKCRFYFFKRLPGAWFFRLKVVALDESTSAVQVPYTWATQNPFQSIYFAALSAAAELSTGVAVLACASGKNMSMLVTKMEGEFLKKAKGLITFTCTDVPAILLAVNETSRTGEGIKIIAHTSGMDQNGVEVARFTFEWSVKAKLSTSK